MPLALCPMRYTTRRLTLTLVLVLAGGCATPLQTAPQHLRDEDPIRLRRADRYNTPPAPAFRRAVQADTRTLSGRPGSDYWMNTADYTLTARLFPEEKRLEGSGRIVYRNNSPDTLDVLVLELAQNLHKAGVVRNEPVEEVTGGIKLERVAVNEMVLEADQEARPTYVEQGTRLLLLPSAPVLPGESTEIAIDWHFLIPQQGAGGRMGYNSRTEEEANLFFLAYWYPVMSVYDDVGGWYTESFMGRAEFYSEFSDYDVTVEAPSDWLVAGTGALQNPEAVLLPDVARRVERAYASDTPMIVLTPDDTATRTDHDTLHWHFTAERMRDVAFSVMRAGSWYWEAARTPVGDRDGDGQIDYTHVNTFWRPSAPLWAEVTGYQQHAISFHSDHTGFPYPWPHMTAVEGGGIIGGGMEFPMMTLMGDYNGSSDTALYAVTAHELAHMWVPMIVNVNERRFSWMDEGTTTFNEDAARQNYYPTAPVDPAFLDQQRYLTVARAGEEGPVMRWSNYHYGGLAFTVASYYKPATLLVALRDLLGHDTFYRAYRSFIDDWAFRHPYPQDFFNTFERVSGRDLDWLWQSFYYETWTLDHALASVDPTEGGVRITVANQGRAPLPVDLTLTLESGQTLTRRIPVEVWLEGREQTIVEIPTESTVERVEIDADRHFPDIDRSDNVWMR